MIRYVSGLGWRAVAIVLLLLAAAGLAHLLRVLNRPYAGYEGEVLLEIPRGMGTPAMAEMLTQHGVVRSKWCFLAVRAFRPRTVLQAGEYRFAGPATPWRVLDRISRGDVFLRLLMVPEGSNVFEIANIVEQMGFITAKEFLAAAEDPSLIRDLAPRAATLEGYLFPSTYHVSRSATPVQLCRLMTDQFRSVWRTLRAEADVHSTVTLASLVEKETALPEERPLVASVYRNRLQLGLRLQCDPTAVYAALLDGAYRGAIHQSDLDRRHLYNTYQFAGLPPGPIASPGIESLRAALAPAETDYIYFVARPGGSGAHVFSTSIEAHNRAVARYRYATRKAARQSKTR